MPNEIIFFSFLIFVFVTTLVAFRLGRAYLFGLIMLEVGLMNIFVVKQYDLFGLAVTGGNILYGGIFLATDVLNEFYGRQIARQPDRRLIRRSAILEACGLLGSVVQINSLSIVKSIMTASKRATFDKSADILKTGAKKTTDVFKDIFNSKANFQKDE